jgi:two-component system OmpR family sensor kinase
VTLVPSIRKRLSGTLFVVSIAWALAVSFVVWVSVRHEVDDLMDDTLQESAEILYGLLSFNASQLPLDGTGSLPAPAHAERLVWQIVSADQRVLLRSHQAPAQPFLAQPAAGLSSVGDEWRVYGLPFDDRGRYLYVAQISSERVEARLETAETTAAAALAVGLVCALWLRSRVSGELKPLDALSAAVARYDPLDARSTLAPVSRAELAPMRDAITHLGTRLARMVANERAFSAHAAHALRTPLAGMVAQLAVAQRKSSPDVRPHLQRTRDAADRLQRVVTALLTMFRAGAEVTRSRIDLHELAGLLPFPAMTITASGAPAIEADAELLTAALMNLLDNSLRHGATQVELCAHVDAGGTSLTVTDNGSGIDEPHRLKLQDALDHQAYDGRSGLGLMLADLVARAHGGRLLLMPVASGCTMEMRLASS